MTIDEQLLSQPELRRRVLEMAIDAAWSMIESNSVTELENNEKWMNTELENNEEWVNFCDEGDRVTAAISLLTELGLLGSHPAHPGWVREISEREERM